MRYLTLTAIGFFSLALARPERSVVFRDAVGTLTALPGETITLEALGHRWDWTAPRSPGLYPLQAVSSDGRDSITIQAFVLVPFSQLKGEYLNGYRIGQYPSRALRGLAIYRPPRGFIEVTRANENTFVSPHFRLKQFLCKQGGAYPQYVVLNEALLQKLEFLLERVNAAGYPASSFHVLSGYRTPAYNRAIGNVPYSRHTFGAAADVFIDEDHDGRMDDLNRDGRSDARDGEVLYSLFEAAGVEGGMGEYPTTSTRGPFVHVDLRDRRTRW
ncbi:MAG TPA: D-Ala-D-Ala carboxypeptidase family metallohydrolase [Gemmatimonadales bacterium]|nr:D-Ala-D-Ala carboxypeptidase family metallohydrolase [Gemmatimonadales bacterium]